MTGSANAMQSSRPSTIFASFAFFAFFASFADKKAVNMTATQFDARISAPGQERPGTTGHPADPPAGRSAIASRPTTWELLHV
jgi:hypothetical protein